MRITRVKPILCDGGWWPWVFAKVETDEGIEGYAECGDNRAMNLGVAGRVMKNGNSTSKLQPQFQPGPALSLYLQPSYP